MIGAAWQSLFWEISHFISIATCMDGKDRVYNGRSFIYTNETEGNIFRNKESFKIVKRF